MLMPKDCLCFQNSLVGRTLAVKAKRSWVRFSIWKLVRLVGHFFWLVWILYKSVWLGWYNTIYYLVYPHVGMNFSLWFALCSLQSCLLACLLEWYLLATSCGCMCMECVELFCMIQLLPMNDWMNPMMCDQDWMAIAFFKNKHCNFYMANPP